jgi:hypothetical protein
VEAIDLVLALEKPGRRGGGGPSHARTDRKPATGPAQQGQLFVTCPHTKGRGPRGAARPRRWSVGRMGSGEAGTATLPLACWLFGLAVLRLLFGVLTAEARP